MPVARAIAKASAAASSKAARPTASLRGQGKSPGGEARKPRPAVAASARSDPKRLAELKVKLADEDYMNGAILRIATVLSARLTLR